MFIESDERYVPDLEAYSDNYDSLTDMLVHEMVIKEEKLTDADLLELSDTLDIPFEKLKKLLPDAEKELYNQLKNKIDIVETFY